MTIEKRQDGRRLIVTLDGNQTPAAYMLEGEETFFDGDTDEILTTKAFARKLALDEIGDFFGDSARRSAEAISSLAARNTGLESELQAALDRAERAEAKLASIADIARQDDDTAG